MKLITVITNYFEHSDLSISGKTDFDKLEKDILAKTAPKQSRRFFSVPQAFLFVFALVLITLAFTVFTSTRTNKSKNQTAKIESAKFAHFQYLPKPQFQNAAPSSLAAPNEYKLKNPLPSAEKVADKSKLSFLPIAYAASQVKLPVYRANHHEFTASDAAKLAEKFKSSGQPKKEGYEPPGYYGFLWEDDEKYFLVSGGSGSGGFEYYLKGPGLPGEAPTDEVAGQKAKDFLTQKGLIDDTYFISGIKHNIWDISKRTGFHEDHKDIYFRKKLEGYQVYDWNIGGGSPTVDKIHVMVGVDGRILYVTYPSYWTTAEEENKTDYALKEPAVAFEDLKAGRGKIAWLDYDAINISTGGYGPQSPSGDFVQHGKLRDVVVESVELAYYHQQETDKTPEYYQPIYLFKAQATLDWKDDYPVDYEGDKFIQGKRTEVVLVASAVPEEYFFNNSVTLTEGHAAPISSQAPVYYPEKSKEKGSFLLKLGVVTPLEDPKRNVYLSWEDVADKTKYNVYYKTAGDKEYSQLASTNAGKTSETVGVNKYFDYYFKVQACTAADCIESNEIFLAQEQKPTFYMKLGTVTPREDPKTEVYLSWSEYPGTMKYNVYLRNSQIEQYEKALEGVGGLSYTAIVNRHNDNYFIIQACNQETCYPSNEILVPKEQ